MTEYQEHYQRHRREPSPPSRDSRRYRDDDYDRRVRDRHHEKDYKHSEPRHNGDDRHSRSRYTDDRTQRPSFNSRPSLRSKSPVRNRESNSRRYDDRRDRHSTSDEPVKFDRNRRLSPFRGDILPLGERPRLLKNWDVAPQGFERIRADIAKQTGLFPPPGNVAKIANFAPPVLDPARAAMLAMLSGDTSSSSNVFVGGSAFGAAYAKHSKRVYVGNLPVAISESEVEDFFNSLLQSDKPASETGDDESPVVAVTFGHDRSFAFVDLRTTELTNLAMDLNGMQFNGVSIKVRRPRDPSEASTSGGNNDDESSNESFVLSNIPMFYEDSHIRLLLQMVGDLKVFIFLRHRKTKKPLGVALIQFDESVFNEIAKDVFSKVDIAENGPMDMKKLSECREDEHLWSILSSFCLVPDQVSVEESNVVMLINLIPLNLINSTAPAEFDGIEESVRQEASKHGALHRIVLPRPNPDGSPTPGLGFCYVEYADAESAQRACASLAGRRFKDDLILTCFYPMDRYARNDF